MPLPSHLQLAEECEAAGAVPVPDFPRETSTLCCAALWSWAAPY